MAKNYTYGPLKSDYFTTYEKVWIEGFCKEKGINLTEASMLSTLNLITMNKAPESIIKKTDELLMESEKFSEYSKQMFIKTWNNILNYSIKTVKPLGKLDESQKVAMKTTNQWWLKQSSKILSDEIKTSYFKSLMIECLSKNGNILKEIKNFNPAKNCSLIETAKNIFSYNGITMPFPNCRLNTIDIKKNEPVLNMIPESDKLISMIVWTAETTILSI